MTEFVLLLVKLTGVPKHPPPTAPIAAAPGVNIPKSNLNAALLQFALLLVEE